MSWESGVLAYLLVAVVLFFAGLYRAKGSEEMRARLRNPLEVFALVVMTLLWIIMVPVAALVRDREEANPGEKRS